MDYWLRVVSCESPTQACADDGADLRIRATRSVPCYYGQSKGHGACLPAGRELGGREKFVIQKIKGQRITVSLMPFTACLPAGRFAAFSSYIAR